MNLLKLDLLNEPQVMQSSQTVLQLARLQGLLRSVKRPWLEPRYALHYGEYPRT